MFDSVRKHQRLLQFVLLLLIFPAFAFFGVSGYQKFLSDDDSLATVDSAKVTRQEMDQAIRQQTERMRQMLGDQLDARMFDTPQARREILEGLVGQRALANEVTRKRISVGDERLREAISALPGLRKADGAFDFDRYRAMLAAQGMSEPGFEYQMRRELAMQQLPEAAAGSSRLPKAVVDRLLVLQEQTREVRERVLRPGDFVAGIQPDAAQIAKYYEEHGAAWEIPESANIEYVVLSASALASGIILKEDELAAAYEQRKAQYTRSEERRVSHILLGLSPTAGDAERKAALSKAEELLRQLKAGGSFAALAKAHSQDPGSASQGGDVGFFARDRMVKPFADAAFALKEGELSGPVVTEYGVHLLKLTGVKAGGTRALAEVRPEVEADLRRQLAGRKFTELAEAFTNLVYEQPDSLKPAAEKFGLRIETRAVNRNGPVDGAGNPVLSSARLLGALFAPDAVKARRNTEAIDVGGNTLVSARIVEHQPATRRALESVLPEVRAKLTEELSRKAAIAAGEEQLKLLREGKGDSRFSGASRTLARVGEKGASPQALEAIFAADASKLPTYVGVEAAASGYVLYEVLKVTTPALADVESKRAAFEKQLLAAVAQQDYLDYLASVKSRAKVTLKAGALAARSENP